MSGYVAATQGQKELGCLKHEGDVVYFSLVTLISKRSTTAMETQVVFMPTGDEE